MVGILLTIVLTAGLGIVSLLLSMQFARAHAKLIALVGAAIGLFAAVVINSLTVISAGHTGVQVTFGEVNPTPLAEGIHFVNPLSSVKDVDVRLQKAELKKASAGTKDLQQVHTDIVINYRMSPQNLPRIYKEFGLDIDDKVLGPAISDAFKGVTGKYTSEELITKREEINESIIQHLREKVAKFNIEVSNVSLVNFGFSVEYQKAVEAKVIALQSKLKAEQDLERIKIEAASRIAQAKGEAEAIAIQAQAIQSNGGRQYVDLQAIEKWDGKLPAYMGSGAMPFINIGK